MSGLEFRDLHRSFGAVHALRGVTFSVAAGEIHACVGENGAGKSTLLKVLAGVVRPDGGEIRWEGERLHLGSPREALARGIGMVAQEMLFFPNLSVSANIFAGREITGRGGRLDEEAMRARTRELLERLHVPIAPDVRMEHLRAASCQLVQVARALAFDCRVLVLDEPTTTLTDTESAHLFRVLASLKARGVTILFVSHRIPEVFRLADRITVLRDGRHVATFDRRTTSEGEVVRAMVGRELPPRQARSGERARQTPALSVRGLSRRPWFESVTFDVFPGETVGLFGLVGSGRTELLETLFGLARAEEGEVLVGGRRVVFASAREAVRAGLALVPEERQRQGLFFNLDLRHNLALPRAAARGVVSIDDADERGRAIAQLAQWAIKAESIEKAPDNLSGGNQQKAVLAKWLNTEPGVLLLDEPTKGVDVGAKFEIHDVIRRQAEAGMACLVVSSDLPEVLALSDRVLVMRQGRVQGELSAAEADEEKVMRLATAPVAA